MHYSSLLASILVASLGQAIAAPSPKVSEHGNAGRSLVVGGLDSLPPDVQTDITDPTLDGTGASQRRDEKRGLVVGGLDSLPPDVQTDITDPGMDGVGQKRSSDPWTCGPYRQTVKDGKGKSTTYKTWVSVGDTDTSNTWKYSVVEFCSTIGESGFAVAPDDGSGGKGYASQVFGITTSAQGTGKNYVAGQQGYLSCWLHNTSGSAGSISYNNCISYLDAIATYPSKCYGSTNADTKGGTYDVANFGTVGCFVKIGSMPSGS